VIYNEGDKVVSDFTPDYGQGIIKLVYPDKSMLVYWPDIKEKYPTSYCIYRYYEKELNQFKKVVDTI
jgi:hypothetical protein